MLDLPPTNEATRADVFDPLPTAVGSNDPNKAFLILDVFGRTTTSAEVANVLLKD